MIRKLLCALDLHELKRINQQAPLLQSFFKFSKVSFDCLCCIHCDHNPSVIDEDYRLSVFLTKNTNERESHD